MKHRIGLTVTDPNHPMVSKRKETIQKTVRIDADNKEAAIEAAKKHYRKKGYKIHDHHYVGTVEEGYNSYHNNRTGFARRPREDDEYHVPDPVGQTHKIAFNVSKDGMEKHNRTVTISNSTKSKEEAKAAARAHLEKQGYKIHEAVEQVDEAAKDHTIEAHGIKGMKGTPWRKTFKSHEHLNDWAEKNDSVEVHGTRDLEKSVNEAWSMGKRNPQRGIKVGNQVRSYDFPGMHDDHYIEGHVVGETPHTYHIRVNKVVRGGKEVPRPAHLSHVEAPKGKGMFSDAYAVHRIMAKQNSVAAAPAEPMGGQKTFANVRGKK